MLDKLEMFIAVARERHFGRAAESLGIAQPTLSAGIKQLEEQLGVQLVIRGSRFGGLTPEGLSALDWARRIVGDARQLREEMRARKYGLTGRLRIAVVPTGLIWAARLSARFTERHPNVRITLLSRPSTEILAMLDDLEIEAGVTYLDNEPMGRLVTAPLYQERYLLVCRDDSRFARLAEVPWAALDGERLCLLTPDMQNRRIIDRNFAEAASAPEALIESNSTVVLVAHVAEGGWLTVLPEEMARFLASGKPLSLVPMAAPGRGHEVGLVAPWREPHTPVLDALLAAARRLAEG